MLLSKDRSQHSGAATAPALHTSQLRCFTKTGLFPPIFPPFWMLDNERESSKGFPRPRCPEHPCKKWQLPTVHPSLPHGKGAARAKSWVCLSGSKLCLSLGVFHLCSIKEKMKKKHFKKPTLNKTAAGRLLD